MSEEYNTLEETILDPLFPELDHKLRSGYHVSMDDIRAYEFLLQAEPHLQTFYSGYRCRLVHGQEGYFYLLSEGELFGRHRLSAPEMLLGQVLALMRMDPAYLKSSGRIPKDHVLSTLEMFVGQQRLTQRLAPRSRGQDRETDNRKIREEVDRALAGLARLGFVDKISDGTELLPRKAIMRFVDPVRQAEDIETALQRLAQTGGVDIEENDENGE